VTDNKHHIDMIALSSWLIQNLKGFKGPAKIDKYSGGQSNPTYRLSTPDQTYVLRCKPPGVLLKSAHAVDREFRVQKALAETAVPVPEMYVLCEDESIINSMFYVMEEVQGYCFDSPQLPDQSPRSRWGMMDEMNRVLAAIHNVDIRAVGLADYGPTGNYYRRQIDRWSKQYRASQTKNIADMEALITWLDQNIPADDGQRSLVHGDYRLDNLLFHKGKCVAVLDWELSTIGHPYADLAAVIMQWSMPPGRNGRGLLGVDRQPLGLWSDQAFIDNYCYRRGLPGIENFGFYLAFCYFRMAAILQGVLKRALDGNASDPERGLQLGRYVPQFAKRGLKAAQGQ